MFDRSVIIYGLYDPRGLFPKIRYIGKTNDLPRRLAQHINRCHDERNDKALWIRELLHRGRIPKARVLARTSERRWRQVERAWIRRGRRRGWPLLNETDGGEGPGRPRWTIWRVLVYLLFRWWYER